ncbi:MAG: hypothetical protein IPK74_11970 [Deltaproteobacteria bacterium]|nr:hypothetical protein [Deltaproteobacteria bacterium]
MPPQLMSQLFATNIFRVMTWTVHFWQIGFPLLLVGMVTRFQLREGFTPLPGWRGWLTRLGWTVIGLASLGVCVVALPVHYVQHPGGPSVQVVQWSVATGWLLAMVAIALLWRKLRDRPPVFTVLGQRIRVDLQTACTWFLGRRLWLTIGVFFHPQIFMLMNIGMFAPIADHGVPVLPQRQ